MIIRKFFGVSFFISTPTIQFGRCFELRWLCYTIYNFGMFFYRIGTEAILFRKFAIDVIHSDKEIIAIIPDSASGIPTTLFCTE